MVLQVAVQMSAAAVVIAGGADWSIRPNPANDFIHIECPDCSDGDFVAVLRNAQGALLIRQQSQHKQFRVNMPQLPPGFYWLELWQDARFLGSKKLATTGKR